jgi:hypothetical protein
VGESHGEIIIKSTPKFSAIKAKEREKQKGDNLEVSESSKCCNVSGARLSVIHLATVIGAIESMILPEPESDEDFDDCQGINLYADIDIMDYDI